MLFVLTQARALHQLTARTSWFRTCLCRLLTMLQACFRSACSSRSMTTLGMPICAQHGHTATQHGHKLQAPGSHPTPFLHATRRSPLDSPRAQSCTVCQRPTTLGWARSPPAHQPLGCSPAVIDAINQRALLGISCNLLRSVALEVFFLCLYLLALLAGCRW